MKGNLPEKEPEILSFWENIDLYNMLRQKSKGKKKFILHYGPPYANGHIHIGHVLSEVLKDVITKSYQMMGYDAPLVPGWDCHGLPIEWKIEEHYREKGLKKDDVDPNEFRKACRDFAKKWIDIQKEEFKRLGIVANWKNPYITMDFENEANIIQELGHFVMNGSLYKGLKPVMWSVVEKTALAEMEVEYHDHVSDSIYVGFKVVQSPVADLKDAQIVIWTTTPWSLPGNRAIAYSPEAEYQLIHLESGETFCVAKDLLEAFLNALGQPDHKLGKVLKGEVFEGTICHHPLHGQGYDFDVPLLPGEHVTIDTGTGFVHTAPSHGIEDFDLGKKYGLDVPDTLNDEGRYYDHVPLFAGQHVYKVNPMIIEALENVKALWSKAKITHSYPHSWRSKTPLIYRAAPQWFISMDKTGLRAKALQAIETVKWVPQQSRNRIHGMVENRPDWCISRQRAWGTPLTLFINKKTGELLRDPKVHARIVEAVRKTGIDAWYDTPAEEFLQSDYVSADYEKVLDVIDVWFDSGCTHSYVLRNHPDLQQWPADLYLEGSDQHRGWFQSSLLHAAGTEGKAPYKQVLTHGFVLDGQGYKMSKSQGNTVAPEKIISTKGADLLRLWAVLCDYTDDLRIGPEILQRQEDIYRRFRNTLRYLLGALDGYEEAEVDYAKLEPLEKWILARLKEVDNAHKEAFSEYTMTEFYMTLHHFCSNDLSAFYFDMRKDTLYCDSSKDSKRQGALYVMNQVFQCLVRWLAPVLSFTAEDAWLARYQQSKGSVHLQEFLEIPSQWLDENILELWKKIRDIRRVVTGAIEVERNAKTIGSSLQANVTLYVGEAEKALLQTLDLPELFITSSATISTEAPTEGAFVTDDNKGVGAIVKPAEGDKCERCWKVLPEVSDNSKKVCQRCEKVVDEYELLA